MPEHTVTVRFHLGEAEDEDTRHNNRVWLRDQLNSRFDPEEAVHTERVARMIDDEKEAFQARLAQKRYGLTLSEDERACLKHILAGAVAERATGAEALYEKVRNL